MSAHIAEILCMKVAAGSTFQSVMLPRYKNRFWPTARIYKGECSKM